MERCKECGLRIRCGDKDRHEAGWHHKRRLETLAQREKDAARRQTAYGKI